MKYIIAVLLSGFFYLAGCCGPPRAQVAHQSMPTDAEYHVADVGGISAAQAGELAVSLANDKCERLYGSRPFLPDHFNLVMKEGRWHWGRLDPVGVHGFSAEVSFDIYGKDRKVHMYFIYEQAPVVSPEP